MKKQGDAMVRAAAHYLFCIVVLALYGGRVCPFLEKLATLDWAFLLLVFFGQAFLVRTWLTERLVEETPLSLQTRRQFILDMALFAAVGLGLTLYNLIVHEFPAGSGAKVILACLPLGLFAAADLALQRQRDIHRELAVNFQELLVEDRFFPLTGKIAIFTTIMATSLTLILFLILYKNLAWPPPGAAEGIGPARRAVLLDVVFVGLIMLGELINLIVSYSRNLKLFLAGENNVLREAAAGRLEGRVPASTQDEFGVMAHYTNRMIDALRERTRELQDTRDVTILTLASLAETRDNETGQHLLRTQRYVRALADRLKSNPRFADRLDEGTIDLLFKSAPLHDIGKVGVPDAILLKPGRLTPEEFEEMKKHALYGRQALDGALKRLGENSFLRLAREIAYTHHEKWDGGGYPEGLAGDRIPISGRLMALADVYDALISRRIYKPAFTHEHARAIIVEGQGRHFDPEMVEAFRAMEREFVLIAGEFRDK
ncbi:MAG: HD domain-containing phosphohydrolase [Pseudomonadota bacterium]